MVDIDSIIKQIGDDWDKIDMSKAELKSWLEENIDKLKDEGELWLGLDIKILSAVENPSHDSRFSSLKSENSGTEKLGYAIKSEEEQIAQAAAMVPDEVDKDGDIVPAAVVKQAARKFLKEKRTDQIDEDHETSIHADETYENKGTVVESWTLDEAQEVKTIDGDSREYPEGTWMVEVEFGDETWQRVKSGDITGYSIHGKPAALDLSEIQKHKGVSDQDNGMSNDNDDNDNVSVQLSVDDIASAVSDQVAKTVEEQVDLEPEVKTEEVYPEVDEYVSEKEIDTEDLMALVADYLEVDEEQVADALSALAGGDEEESEEEESEEENEQEEEENVERNASEKSQTESEESEENEQKEEEEAGEFEDLFDLEL